MITERSVIEVLLYFNFLCGIDNKLWQIAFALKLTCLVGQRRRARSMMTNEICNNKIIVVRFFAAVIIAIVVVVVSIPTSHQVLDGGSG